MKSRDKFGTSLLHRVRSKKHVSPMNRYPKPFVGGMRHLMGISGLLLRSLRKRIH